MDPNKRRETAFTAEHPGDLWMGDAVHGPPVVGAELPTEPLPLADLNRRHAAWLTCEYHRRVHGTTHQSPRDHLLAGAEHLRPVPRDIQLGEVFLHREARKVRADGTVRWEGDFYEVPGEPVTPKLRFEREPRARG